MDAPSSKVDEALSYAEGVLDRTALSIGVRTDAESEREFRNCIGMAMGSIRHAISSERSAEPQKAAYRLLVPAVDRIEATDEFLSEDTLSWVVDPKAIFAGMLYGGRALRPARRPIVD